MDPVILKKGKDKRYVFSHLWIFESDIDKFSDAKPGDIVEVYDYRNRFLGKGFYNPDSKIRVRIVTNIKEEINEKFFEERIRKAVEYRKDMLSASNCCRLIAGEGDLLPGLIVDKYSDYLSVQILSAGTEKRKDKLLNMLNKIVSPKGIAERSDPVYRKREGLPESTGTVSGKVPERVIVSENGIRFNVDLLEGQKTGFFLDQKENRLNIRKYAEGRRVLDMFCNTGGFSLNAAFAGASEVMGVDSSEKAVNLARENAQLNKLNASFIEGNAFNLLRKYSTEKRKYDMVVLDPPAFAKGRGNIDTAFAGYKEINLRAIKMLTNNGIIVSCSCSHHINKTDFWYIIQEAARDARRRIRLLEFRGQAKDHPVISGVPETEYLKCVIGEVM